MGAEVINYTRGLLLWDLRATSSDSKFDLVVDRIFANPELFLYQDDARVLGWWEVFALEVPLDYRRRL